MGSSAPTVTIPITLPEQAALSSAITTVEIVGLPEPTPTPTPLPLANGDWAALTDPNDMNELVVISNTVWIAGNGGAVAWTRGSTTPVVYTAADGLYGNQLTSVANCALPGFGVVFGSPAGLQIGDPRTGRWRQVTRSGDGGSEGMRFGDVATIYCDAGNGFLIVGYAAHGIDIYDAGGDKWRHLDRSSGLAANDVNDLAVVGDRDEVWVASDEGVTVSAGSDSAFYDANNSDLAADRIGALAVAPDDSVWLGGDGAFTASRAIAGPSTPQRPSRASFPVARSRVWRLLRMDRSGLAPPMPSFAALTLHRAAVPIFIQGAPGMAAGPLTSLSVDAEGAVYYTTAGNGYAMFDGDEWRTLAVRRPALLGNRVQALTADAAGNLWAATEEGVQRIAAGESPELFAAEDVGIAVTDVRALHPGQDGGVWVGGVGGASFFDDSGWQKLTGDDGLVGTMVRAITVDGEGRTWFGTDQGISIWNGSSFFTIDKQHGLPSDDIRALAADPEGVWIGTSGGGLYRFAGSQLQILNKQNVGLPSDTISQLEVGPDGALWIGSDRGLARLADGRLNVVEELGEPRHHEPGRDPRWRDLGGCGR